MQLRISNCTRGWSIQQLGNLLSVFMMVETRCGLTHPPAPMRAFFKVLCGDEGAARGVVEVGRNWTLGLSQCQGGYLHNRFLSTVLSNLESWERFWRSIELEIPHPEDDTFWKFVSKTKQGPLRVGETVEQVLNKTAGAIRQLEEDEEKPKVYEREVDRFGEVHATGTRKTARAEIVMRKGTGEITVNGMSFLDYFPMEYHRTDILRPFTLLEKLNQFDVIATTRGGGMTGQAQAIRYACAWALVKWDPPSHALLSDAELLTRDYRQREEKKSGKKRARKSFPYVRR
eukprot:Rmarinus@m.483